MRKLRWISIVLLVVGAAGLGYKLRADWRTFRTANDPAAIKMRPLTPVSAPVATAAPDYIVVARQNPFHPERNDALPPPPPAAVQPSGPPPLVYGSMLLGKEKIALMATEGDPKPRKIAEGEDFQGYKLAEVKQQSVVLESGGAKSEVMFYNALSRLHRDTQRTTPSTPATASGPAATVTTGAPAATENSQVLVPPPLPPATAGTPAPPGKVRVMTPFGPMWQDAKQ